MPTHRPLDEATAQALLAGRSITAGEDALLAAFISDLRMAAQGPPPTPSPALASVLDGGLATDKGDLPVTAASNVPGPAPQAAGLPKWRRKKMIIASLLGGLSLPAKALIGVSMAATSIGGAAAAGVPAAQDAVEAVSHVEFPDNDNAEHGKNVSDTARTTDEPGSEKGEAVSEAARLKGEEMRQDGDHPSGPPAAPGSTGLGTASGTPASESGHLPTAVPATPAAGAGNAPADTPAGPPAETPASSAPVVTPAGPPEGAPVADDAPPSSAPVDAPVGPPAGTPTPPR